MIFLVARMQSFLVAQYHLNCVQVILRYQKWLHPSHKESIWKIIIATEFLDNLWLYSC